MMALSHELESMPDDDGERPWTPSPPRITPAHLRENRTPLPAIPWQTTSSPASGQSQHYSSFLSLAAEISDKAINDADAPFASFLRNVRDSDLGQFFISASTQFVGRGATFAVRRTVIPDHKVVVFKSLVRNREEVDDREEVRRLEAVLLELRVLTHPPLRTHENIVKLIQVGWEGDSSDEFRKWPVLVVEYADRGTLVDYFDHELSLTYSTRQLLCSDVAEGLLALHDCGIVHGDLKPENVLVFSTDDARPVIAKLSDFGGALLDGDTLESIPMPTPPWNAPESPVVRTRGQLLKSDIYSLGLVIWAVVLNVGDPFKDKELFNLPTIKKERAAALDAEKAVDSVFLDKVKVDVSRRAPDADTKIIFLAFDASIRTDEALRDLVTIVELFRGPTERLSALLLEADSDKAASNRIRQDEPIEFSFAGFQFTGNTACLFPKITESMIQDLEHHSIERRLGASVALAMTNLASDDFGVTPDIDRGLTYLIVAAELGSRAYQALVLRMHKAFNRPVPDSVRPKIREWLLQAAATGSMTALEDLRQHRYDDEVHSALHLLQTRYCGVGEEIFEYDVQAIDCLSSPERNICHDYIAAQIKEGQDIGQDWSGYLLRVAAAYGSPHGIKILVDEYHTDCNDANEMGDTPLLFATRSGHLDALLTLLHFGANPTLINYTEDTPLHWLCSFSEDSVKEAATALIHAGANIDAQAKEFPPEPLEYAETAFISGTPLHRTVARNKPTAVQALLDLGADPHTPTDEDPEQTPFALAVLLHYPHIVNIFLSKKDEDVSRWLLSPSGRSILIPAMSGGTLYGSTMGRLIRHGSHLVSHIEETLSILLQAGAASHLSDIPGMPGCTAAYYASQCHVAVLDFLLRNGADKDVNRLSTRDADEEEDMRRPPLFEAVLFGKAQNVRTLLQYGADPRAVMNPITSTSILYQCAEIGFQDLPSIKEFLKQVGVDDTAQDFGTPFAFAVLNRCFVLAELLRERGANVNALFTRLGMGGFTYPTTLLRALAEENSQGSISCVKFLFRQRAGYSRINLTVEPARNHTVFHALAKIRGDSQDGLATLSVLDLCGKYFGPTPEDLNQRSTANDDASSVEDAGHNTALHLAVIHANLEVVKWLLVSCQGVDTSIRNATDLTALDLATLSYPTFHRRFQPRAVPQHPSKQLAKAQARRNAILKLLESYTPSGVTPGTLERFYLSGDSSDNGDDSEVPPNVKFEVEDAEFEWPYIAPFNYIHGRSLCGAIGDRPKLYGQALHHLKHSGWIESQEYKMWLYSDDDTLKELATNCIEYQERLDESSEKFGKKMNSVTLLKGRMRDAGFVDVRGMYIKYDIVLRVCHRVNVQYQALMVIK